MKYYLIGFFVLITATGLSVLWGFVDIKWFFTVLISATAVFFTLDMLGVK